MARELTAVVYVDHNMGTVVKDAFVVPQPIDELAETMLQVADDPDTEARELAPADARARITEAVESGAMTYPPFETESWPACRPLVEWMVGHAAGRRLRLPACRVGRRAPSPSSPPASSARPTGPGSTIPITAACWSRCSGSAPTTVPATRCAGARPAVEILLLDWIPRKIVADPRYLAMVPELLRAFIRFCHQERGIRPALTDETLDAVDGFEREYQRTIRSPRAAGPGRAAGRHRGDRSHRPSGSHPFAGELEELHEIMLDALRRAVGGEQALDRLDADPLPDEDFDWADVPADIHDRVAEVLGLVDRFCAERLDAEFRTACRRLLARAAGTDPAIFRRRGRADTAAAAVCWVIGKANLLFDPRSEPHLSVKELSAALRPHRRHVLAAQRAVPARHRRRTP